MNRMRWQDWAAVVLGLWLIAAPWVLGYSDVGAATRSGVLAGLGVIALEFADAFRPDPWPELRSFLLGLWIAVSPMLLGFATHTLAMTNTAVVGILIVWLCLSAIVAMRRKESSPSH